MLIRPRTTTIRFVPDPVGTDSADLQIHLSLCLCVSLSVGYGISSLFNYNLLFGCMWTSLKRITPDFTIHQYSSATARAATVAKNIII